MDKFLKWIEENKEWLFSGLGITLIGLFIAFSKRIKKFLKNSFHRILTYFKAKKILKQQKQPNYDDSLFISEMPYDGISVPINKIFKKSWTIKNNGNIVWKGRILRCVEFAGDCFYPVNNEIKVPTTLPGEIITLSVEYHVKQLGNYRSKWKMYDKENNEIYPNKKIGLMLHVIAVEK